MKPIRKSERDTYRKEIRKKGAYHTVCGCARFRPLEASAARILVSCEYCRLKSRRPGEKVATVSLLIFDRQTGELAPYRETPPVQGGLLETDYVSEHRPIPGGYE